MMYEKFCNFLENLTARQIYWIGACSISVGVSMQQSSVIEAFAVEFVTLGIFAVIFAIGLTIAENEKQMNKKYF